MNMVLTVILYVSSLGLTTAPPATKEWRGLRPLHSTRSDVERLLGPPSGWCKCFYETDREVVHVDYATTPCQGPLSGWNVPADTVLRLTVRPKEKQKFADPPADGNKYIKVLDDTLTAYYGSRDEGIRYGVSASGLLTSVAYIASAEDQSLRCSGFPTEDVSIVDYRPYDNYTIRAWEDTEARIDLFAAQLDSQVRLKGFVIIYAGEGDPESKMTSRVKRIKSFIDSLRTISPKRITVMAGGRRKTAELDFFLVSNDMPAPIPSPTLP